MICGTLFQDDQVINFQSNPVCPGGPSVVNVTITDVEYGSSESITLTATEFNAMLTLMAGSHVVMDSTEIEEALYEIIEPRICHLPAKLRPIP